MKFAGTTDEAALAVRSDEPAAHESRTRDRIARSILENGPSTADGLIEERAPRASAVRGRGRPARLLAVTDAGRDSFDQGYDDLAASAMQFLEQHGGREAVAAFARQRVAELEARYRPVVEQAPAGGRTEALAIALSGDGYAATTRTAPGPGSSLGEQLCQHHCPVAHVATQ